MRPKKYDNAKLENKRVIFFQIGLIVTLGLILVAFEWPSHTNNSKVFEISDYHTLEEEFAKITRQPELKPPPPKPKLRDVINIIPDEELPVNDMPVDDFEPEFYDGFDIEEFIDPEDAPDDTPFIIVEDMPTFRGGGLEGFRDWVMANIQYPAIAAENRISGKVYVQFVVGFNGDVEDVFIYRSADPSLDREVVRVVSSSPRWSPGSQRGKPARVQFVLPINFVLK